MEPYVVLERAIESATSETLQKPDESLLQEACQLISSRADMPKEAIKYIKKRLQLKNGKVLYLALELLEMATFFCGLSLHSQIASKEFMMQINNLLLLKELPPQVTEKLMNLIKVWNQLFEPSKDLLPVFFEYITKWEAKGHKFPTDYQSKFSKIRKSSTISSSSILPSSNSEGPKRNEKLEQDLEIARQNLYLTNEIIDAHDHIEDVKRNDALTDLMNTFKGLDEKLKDLIRSGDKLDSALMSFCLEFNDELLNTYKRYESLEKRIKPQPFKKSSTFLKTNEPEPLPKEEKPQPLRTSGIQNKEPPKLPEPKRLAAPLKPPQETVKKSQVTSVVNPTASAGIDSLIDIAESIPSVNQPNQNQNTVPTGNTSQIPVNQQQQLAQSQQLQQPDTSVNQGTGAAVNNSQLLNGSQVSFGVQSIASSTNPQMMQSTQSAFFNNGSQLSNSTTQSSNIMNLYNQPVYNQGGFPGMMGGAGMQMGMVPMNPMMMAGMNPMMNSSGINPMMASGMNPMMNSGMNPMMASSGINPMMASGMNPMMQNSMMNMNMMGMMQGSFGFNNNMAAAQQQQMMMSMMNNSSKMNMGEFGDMGSGLMNNMSIDNSKVNDPNAKKPFDELDEMFAVKSKNNPGTSANLI